MKLYTTGELAKACDITVRTVQFYDTRGLLSPSEFSEGGRRLYTEKELDTLKLICFLRELDFSLDDIKRLFAEENAGKVIAFLLGEQERTLRQEIADKTEKADAVAALRRALSSEKETELAALPRLAKQAQNKKQLKALRIRMLAGGLLMNVLEIASLLLAHIYGMWWLLAIALVPIIALGIMISRLYFRKVAYICPECHTVFQPTLKESFWAYHTPNTRKLTCPHCKRIGFCIETYHNEETSC